MFADTQVAVQKTSKTPKFICLPQRCPGARNCIIVVLRYSPVCRRHILRSALDDTFHVLICHAFFLVCVTVGGQHICGKCRANPPAHKRINCEPALVRVHLVEPRTLPFLDFLLRPPCASFPASQLYLENNSPCPHGTAVGKKNRAGLDCLRVSTCWLPYLGFQ